MSWIPLVAWLAGLVVAAVILGFCAYEMVWKTRRLHRDMLQLQGVADEFAQLRSHLVAAKQRLARTGGR